ncbi:MAG TPA: oligosaccharide flippase family protein [Aggregatilineaceae bacterium]|nr:oligosaccharide flippase family protein [Aggregatilineaceae bacterium]
MSADDGTCSASLGRNTAYMLMAQGARLVVQAFYFLLMARGLGPEQYGAFVAVAAAVAIAYPFVGNGSGNLMVKNVARDRRLLSQWLGNALFMTLASGLLLSVLVVPACRLVLPPAIPASVILMVVASDLLVYRLVDVACLAFQSVEKLSWTANLSVFASLMRLGGIAAVVSLHRPTVTAWCVAYLATSGVCALVAVYCVLTQLARPAFSGLKRIGRELREGFWFSTSFSAQTIYNDLDKTMLARLATLDAAGVYAAAYRLIDVAFLPVRALLAAAYPGFFRYGADGIAGSFSFTRRLVPGPLIYSAAAAAGMTVAAPLVPHILGAEYARTTEALRWLAVLPLLKTCHYFAADALTGAGYQALRTSVQVVIAAFNVVINLWLIPRHSWRGAAWSSLASDGLLAMALWSCALVLRARSTTAASGRTAGLAPAN